MKSYRRFIRVGNRLVSSPRFSKKADAEEWFHQMRRKKQLFRDGIEVVADADDSEPFIKFAQRWLIRRFKDYPKATTSADDQRLKDYILPFLSELPIASINSSHIRNLLMKISEPGFRENMKSKGISTKTRTRVKALLSVIFRDALNEDPPLVKFNPVLGLKIHEKRKGSSKPRVIADKEAIIKFLQCAQETGWTEYVIISLFLMSGLRKQELVALRWSSIDFKHARLLVSEKYEQSSNSIVPGTKGGEQVTRVVPLPATLLETLKQHKEKALFKKDADFVICRHDGRFLNSRDVNRYVENVRGLSKIDISPHGLRHTYGREFALNTGNVKALQAILGHTSSATTDIYSDLAGDRIKGFAESVSFEVGVKGVKGSLK